MKTKMKNNKLRNKKEEYISPAQAETLYGLFKKRAEISPNNIAYKYFDLQNSEWRHLKWKEALEKINIWKSSFFNEQFSSGDKVAVQLKNCPEWIFFDQSALANDLITVPLYMDDRPDNVGYILEETKAKFLLIQNFPHLRKLEKIIEKNKFLKKILILENRDNAQISMNIDDRVEIVSDWLKKGGDRVPEESKQTSGALASIVYTSGTSGRPKGVMLSHSNILSVAHGGLSILKCFESDTFLSFLPLSHTLERSVGYYAPIMAGATVAFSRSASQLADDLRIIKPTLLVSVPRIYEKFHSRIEDQLRKKNLGSKYLYKITINIGWNKFLYEQNRGRKKISFILWPLLNYLVARKILKKLGGNLRLAICGGAPLNKFISRTFIGLGLPITQGYGLTETSPIVSANPIENNYPDSVGLPIPGVKVRLGRENELEVKSPGVMMGYWNNAKATAKVIDRDGWLKTGDQAQIVESGHIFITGRLKDIMVLSNGEKISPSDIELSISIDKLIRNLILIGEGLPFLVAIVAFEQDDFLNLCREFNFHKEISINDVKVKKVLLKRMNNRLNNFPGYAKIRNCHIVIEEWNIESGFMTPTLKLKREKIFEKYREFIEELY